MSDNTTPAQTGLTVVGDVEIITFGYLHLDGGPAPEADVTYDVRRYLSDPAAVRNTGLLDCDGRDDEVRRVVLDTWGAPETLDTVMDFVLAFPSEHRCVIAFGCAGGRHRSVALAEVAAEDLRTMHYRVTVRHLHVHLPRVISDSASGGAR
ncbi:hypothetical protein ACIRG5_11210 [Lentzea sp. NPDC102401]|uniref:RapZ C-terminal domain-containing protein n=1 Tax=Lentzea sp. NPDC102401 TaxID=3364128 RepID=UPI00381E0DD4